MKTIEDAVIERKGKWFTFLDCTTCPDVTWFNAISGVVTHVTIRGGLSMEQEEFQSAAKRMGYINGYRYGEEYPTNGKRPDLPDDVLIEQLFDGDWYGKSKAVIAWRSWDGVTAFRITDPRYKPVSEIPECKPADAGVSVSADCNHNWHERGEFPPAGTECEVNHNGHWVAASVVGWFGTHAKCAVCAPNGGGFYGFYQHEIRPIKSEREIFIAEAIKAAKEGRAECDITFAGAMFDSGKFQLTNKDSK